MNNRADIERNNLPVVVYNSGTHNIRSDHEKSTIQANKKNVLSEKIFISNNEGFQPFSTSIQRFDNEKEMVEKEKKISFLPVSESISNGYFDYGYSKKFWSSSFNASQNKTNFENKNSKTISVQQKDNK